MKQFDTIHAKKLGDKGIRALYAMAKVMRQNPSQKLAFGSGHGLDHILSITGIKEELSTLRIRNKFNKTGIAADAAQKLILIDSK